MNSDLYLPLLEYIENYWAKITFSNPRSGILRIGLPRPFVSPNHIFFKNDLFYWDSYFIILGLLNSRRIDLAKDVVENLLYLLRRYGIIFARNLRTSWGRTQPPFLTQMALEIYKQDGNLEWLAGIMAAARREYRDVWHNNRRFVAEVGLNRYCPLWGGHYFAEHESGWDMTSRFEGRCLDVIPTDLNCLLYQYEMDFAKSALLEHKPAEENFWLKKAIERKDKINKLLWDEKEGLFYDYDFRRAQKMRLKTLAAYYPLWCNQASSKQAAALVAKLPVFENSGGLANTEEIKSYRKQWDWPNGWPNQQWIVIKGLLNYGFLDEARRLARKWLELNREVFERTGRLWEKYDVVKRDIGQDGLYSTQEGFGWTNAIFLKLLSEQELVI